MEHTGHAAKVGAPNQLTKRRFHVIPTLSVYAWSVVDSSIANSLISRHRNLGLALHAAERLNKIYQRDSLPLCEFETPESCWGACDGGIQCRENAVVSHLATQSPMCFAHFLQEEMFWGTTINELMSTVERRLQ